MLHFLIIMSNSSDEERIAVTPRTSRSEARPLNARSLALSALLGTHPPTLPARSLVALAEVFGINAGTMRTALSRMVAAGDVSTDDAGYTLSPRLVARQVAQDAGRHRVVQPWNGAWHTAVASVEQRDLSDRRHVRAVMADARFGELRTAIWLRPANLASPDLGPDWLVTTGPTRGTPSDELVARLWDVVALGRIALGLLERVERMESGSDDDPVAIPAVFSLSAEIVRFLRSDPLLPQELTPPDWPLDRLRSRYRIFERHFRARLRPILAA